MITCDEHFLLSIIKSGNYKQDFLAEYRECSGLSPKVAFYNLLAAKCFCCERNTAAAARKGAGDHKQPA